MSKSHVNKKCMTAKEKMEKEDTAGKGSASSRNGQLKEDYISREEKKSVFHSARSVFENSSYLETTRKGESSTVLSKTSQSTETRSETLKQSSQRTSVVTVSPQKGRQYENDNFTKQPPEKPDRKSTPGLSNNGTFLVEKGHCFIEKICKCIVVYALKRSKFLNHNKGYDKPSITQLKDEWKPIEILNEKNQVS